MEPVTIELIGGYTSRDGQTHKRVTFGKRLKGKALFKVDGDPQARSNTQYQDLILRDSITEFGTLTMPVPLQVLLELDSVDRDDLAEARNRFSRESLAAHLAELGVEEGQAPDVIDECQVRLAYGYDLNGIVYDVVEFGTRLTGMHEVKADTFGYTGARRTCFLAGQQVKKLKQSAGESEIPGPIGLDVFQELDAIDIQTIQIGVEAYRESFRLRRENLPKVGDAHNDSADSGVHGLVGTGNPGATN